MRTTIDLPDDLHQLATNIARDKRQTLSQVVVDLMRIATSPQRKIEVRKSAVSGFPTLHGLGRPITTEDVRSLEDDE